MKKINREESQSWKVGKICHQSNEKFAGESTHHQSKLDNVFFCIKKIYNLTKSKRKKSNLF